MREISKVLCAPHRQVAGDGCLHPTRAHRGRVGLLATWPRWQAAPPL